MYLQDPKDLQQLHQRPSSSLLLLGILVHANRKEVGAAAEHDPT